MASLLPDFEYDVFISYRQRDNKYDRWVTEFVHALNNEVQALFKEDISIYFDENPHDGLHDHHQVEDSLRNKLKCLIFIPVISHTYCDPNSFAWNNEFQVFLDMVRVDQFGLKIETIGSNYVSRVLPIRIHDIDSLDQQLFESEIGDKMRSINFVYKTAGVNRPLRHLIDDSNLNVYPTLYRDQINKLANAIKEIILALKGEEVNTVVFESENNEELIQPITKNIGFSYPASATSLLGREKELSEILDLLKSNRIVTIIGTGGVGKTRISLEVCKQATEYYKDGVVFIAMTSIDRTSELIPKIASELHITEGEGKNQIDGISALLNEKQVLMVLDNMEHVIEGAIDVAELSSKCPNLTLLVTSRTPLKIKSEQEYSLLPLPLLSQEDALSVEVLLSNSSIQLFYSRAKAVHREFDINDSNFEDINKICRRLDGLPLALELCAARIRLLSPGQLLNKLSSSLDFLHTKSPDVPERHQTLRATIDWSHSLLNDSEKRLFRRLVVFAGGFTMSAIEAVCYDDEIEASRSLDELESLIDKALVMNTYGSGRFYLLQTIDDYAKEQLDLSGEKMEIMYRHSKFFLSIAQNIERGIHGVNQLDWMKQGDLEEANMYACLDFLVERANEGNKEAAEIGLQICGNNIMYWHVRGKNISGYEYVEALLESPECPENSAGRCNALLTKSLASWILGKFELSVREAEESHQIARNLGLDYEEAYALVHAAFFCLTIDFDKAYNYSKESLVKVDAQDVAWLPGLAYSIHGIFETIKGNLDVAKKSYGRALEVFNQTGDRETGGVAYSGLAQVANIEGDLDQSIKLYKKSYAEFATIGDRAEEGRILNEMAWVLLKKDTEESKKYFLQSIQAYKELGSLRGEGLSIYGLAAVESIQGNYYKAVEIAAAADSFVEQGGIVNVYNDQFEGKTYIEEARNKLGETELNSASNNGKGLSVEKLISLVKVESS